MSHRSRRRRSSLDYFAGNLAENCATPLSDHSQIDEHAREICYDAKTHTPPQHGKIVRLMVVEGHRFSRTANGRDLYVTRENVVHIVFDQLAPGMPM